MRRWAIAVCSLLLVVPVPVRAQARLTGADLDGTISDQTGAVVPGCTIAVTNRDTNVTRLAIADGIGHYAVPALPPGTYIVSATVPRFTPQTRDGITLLLGEASTIDFALTVADATDTVTVEAPASVLSTNRTTMASVIQQQQIQSLPINGRSFIGFALIAPGVATDRTPLQGAGATSGLSFTGQRGRSNNVTVDGRDNNDPIMGSVRAIFSQDAVREFQVLVNSYSAEFGHASGGVVNIVTNSGTNTPHGGAFFFFRDKALNAKGYFDTDTPPFGQKQWGGTLGGPVRRNRTFLFTSFEQNTIRDARLVTIDPTAAALLNEAGFPVDLGIVPLAVRNTEALVKLDHQWTAARTLTLRGTYADVDHDGIDDFGGIVARSRGTAQLRTDWSVSAAETLVFSSHGVNELRGQFAHENQHVIALDPLCQGPCNEIDEGGPTLELTGVASVGRQRFTPQVRLYDRVQLADTVSVERGAHHLKIGADYNHITLPGSGNWLPSHFGGRYIFAAIPSLGVSSALDALQKGMPAAYIQGYGTAHYPDERYQDLALFAQDEWKHGRLVIRPGVRYQRQFFQPATFTSSDVGGGTISFPLPSDPNNIAPRIGASFDMTGDGRTILHGSYGVFYDNIIMIMESPSRLGNGSADGIRTLVLPAPAAAIAWNAPNHRLTESRRRGTRGRLDCQRGERRRSGAQGLLQPSGVGGLRSPADCGSVAECQRHLSSWIQSARHLRIQSSPPGDAGPRAPAERSPVLDESGRALRERRYSGLLGNDYSANSLCRQLVHRPGDLAAQAIQPWPAVSVVLHALKDGRYVDRFSEQLPRAEQRLWAQSGRSVRTAARVRSRVGAWTGHARSAASRRRLRHLSSAVGSLGIGHRHGRVGPAVHAARRRGPEWRRQWRTVSAGSREAQSGG